MQDKKKIKAIVLLSGGLDSGLAAKIVKNQGIALVGITFKSYFFDLSGPARKQAEELKIPLKIVDISQEQLDKVLSPEYGYGAGLNPCIDCHLLMVKFAHQQMVKEKGEFLVTGDVLGQRPLSQNRLALELIDRAGKVEGLVLRPLSAKFLHPTKAENKGWIKREDLFNIKGRSRKTQIFLAEKFGLKNYTAPAGGCLLTDVIFSKKLARVVNFFPNPSPGSLRLAALGRHFWLDKAWIVVGRNHQENEQIKQLVEKGDCLVELSNISGPTIIIKGNIDQKAIKKARELTKKYASKARNKSVEFLIEKI
ncbi:MAG: tRNA 4-thiouridine(8) synthase ThiI [Candidatus Shapirobacteria bacterium]|nr:tRNA 4-thiouridine(8) synthase ThiI [Candidatus Shapirobacteria bacterium]